MIDIPSVTVQIPLFNEQFVAARILRAVGNLIYPAEKLQIQVLDDSDDHTTIIVDEVVQELRRAGLDVDVIRRTHRIGYKAGALKEGMKSAKYDFIAIFDADFIPKPSFLTQTMSAFSDDIAVVQARWGHINASNSLLTQSQAVFLDGHFSVEHAARFNINRWFNFNGTAGIWRKAAIVDAGGWSSDTVTEDLDLSYRAQLKGWKFVYLDDVVVPAELPGTILAFKNQQHRWAKGATQTARKLLPKIWGSRNPLGVKYEATIHLTSNFAYPLMVLLALLLPWTIFARIDLDIEGLIFIDFVLFSMTTVSIGFYYYMASIKAGRSRRESLWQVPMALALGVGMGLSQTSAVFAGMVSNGGEFVRTPKQGAEKNSHYRNVSTTPGWPECLMAIYMATGLAWTTGMYESWPSIPFLLLFMVGYGFVGGKSLLEWFSDNSLFPTRTQRKLEAK